MFNVFHYKALIFEEAVRARARVRACGRACVRAGARALLCALVCTSACACGCMCGCACIRVSEAEVARLFQQTLVRTPVWECAGVRSCANRRILLCKEPPDTRSPPKGVAGRSLSQV